MLSFRLCQDNFAELLLVTEDNRFLQNRSGKEVHLTVDVVKGKVMVSIEANITHFVLGKLAVDFIRV